MQGSSVIGDAHGARCNRTAAGNNPRSQGALLIALIIAACLDCASAAGANPTHHYNYDGPGPSDIGIYRAGRFWFFRGSTANLESYPLGGTGDVPLAADFDGDGRTDFALYNPSARTFHWVRSSDGVSTTLATGNWGDIPVAVDFDGDGKTDLAIYRPVDAIYWLTQSSNNQLISYPIGQVGDLPVIGDFDGDGRDELGVFTPATATFTFFQSSNGARVQIQVGQAGDVPLVADYDGDGKSDLAVYHAPTSTFTYRRSSDGQTISVQFGQHGDTPMVGDYDGDGKTDIAVFRAQQGSFNIILYRSSSTLQTVTFDFGNPADTPLGARFAPAEQSSGLSYVNLPSAPQTIYQFGVPHTDKNGRSRTALDSASFLPRCVVGTFTNDFAALPPGGFNCTIPWNGYQVGDPLAAASAAGIQIVQDIGPARTNIGTGQGQFSPTPDCSQTSNAGNPICVKSAQVGQVKDNPAILAWKAEDEPSGSTSIPDCQLRAQVYTSLMTAVGQMDPTHPVFNVDIPPPSGTTVCSWIWWNSISPVASNDNYPIGATQPNSLANSASDYQALVADNSGTTPIWIMPQAFSGTLAPFVWTMPTPIQLRAEVFTALVHGATGIFYFIYDNAVARGNCVIGISPNPQVDYGPTGPCRTQAMPSDITASQTLWNEAVTLNSELARLQNVILSPTATSSYQVGTQSAGITPTPIRTMLKVSSTGVYTLLMINVDNMPLNVQVTLPSKPVDLYSISTGGARGPMSPYNNTIWDSIEGFGVRIYEFK
jgi:hypothetical protein